ncbi:MAG: Glu/Leu/Phe/Val dehydrogenase dimerization domain-containing protein [Pseudomonadota bacterium]
MKITEEKLGEHERVAFISDAGSGLKAIIAVHSTALGPAAGGCRVWAYASQQDALGDVLKLSQGMSYKNAMAGLHLGGGKAVILGPIDEAKRRDVFRAFGAAIEMLGGAYITAEDVGVRVADMQAVAEETAFVTGVTAAKGIGGDPSPYTARGVLQGIKAAVRHKFGHDDLSGLRIAVQGLGNVGGNLCQLLVQEDAELFITDIDTARVAAIEARTGAAPFALDALNTLQTDVFAPCALGGVVTEHFAQTVNVPIIAGGANNQLLTPAAGDILHARRILYAPDYVINAGGIVVVDAEYRGDSDIDGILSKVDAIGARVSQLFDESEHADQPTYVLADQAARAKISAAQHAAKALEAAQ